MNNIPSACESGSCFSKMENTPQQQEEGKHIIRVLACVLNKLIEANQNAPNLGSREITKFHALEPPNISVLDYLERIHKYACCSNECFILSLIYIDRLIQMNNFALTGLNVHRVIITSIMLAAKFFDDQYFNNAYYAKVGGVPVSEMNSLEVELLFRLNFSLHVTTDAFRKYKMELCHHATVNLCTCAPEQPGELAQAPAAARRPADAAVAPQAPTVQPYPPVPVQTAAPAAVPHQPSPPSAVAPQPMTGVAVDPAFATNTAVAGAQPPIAYPPGSAAAVPFAGQVACTPQPPTSHAVQPNPHLDPRDKAVAVAPAHLAAAAAVAHHPHPPPEAHPKAFPPGAHLAAGGGPFGHPAPPTHAPGWPAHHHHPAGHLLPMHPHHGPVPHHVPLVYFDDPQAARQAGRGMYDEAVR